MEINFSAFKKITLEDRDRLLPFLTTKMPRTLSGMSFPALLNWSLIYNYCWLVLPDQTLLIAGNPIGSKQFHFLEPRGQLSKSSQHSILEFISSLDYQLIIHEVSQEFLNKYPEFVANFASSEDRGYSNYIYKSEDLVSLGGGVLRNKRNLIAQAKKTYNWIVSDLSLSDIAECKILLNEILPISLDQDLSGDKLVTNYALDNFSDLKQQGVVIRINNTVQAFSIYNELTPEMAVVHVEKANREYKGLYQIINQETAKKIAALGYKFINREDDLNIDGLRQAKMSYNPIEIYPAYSLNFIGN
jgi:hypothetical protein